ncbi:AP-4 complex accessory subunit RUSC1 [Oncorhynchus nerka]|uniref:AP-4 complex accessory subunit RUSC1 n=1 Tax=Oncorhynchus nerka TaxID=8023 RepID=UPI0031B88747
MGDDVKAPLRGLGLSSLCLLEKRALVSAVSVAVEAILAQFSSSRTLVQKSASINKALSGDSSVNPSLGRLVLQCLCPALRSLLSDGLKPHQSDLISGRRPNSAWGLVQASTRPGPSTQSLYSLQARIGELPQLRQNKHRFNAFLLGLLNIKLMDFWLSHLQSCSDVLVTFYQPSSFITTTWDPANHSPEIPSPPNQDLGFRLSPGVIQQGWGLWYAGGKLGQNLAELSLSAVQNEEGTSRDPRAPDQYPGQE